MFPCFRFFELTRCCCHTKLPHASVAYCIERVMWLSVNHMVEYGLVLGVHFGEIVYLPLLHTLCSVSNCIKMFQIFHMNLTCVSSMEISQFFIVILSSSTTQTPHLNFLFIAFLFMWNSNWISCLSKNLIHLVATVCVITYGHWPQWLTHNFQKISSNNQVSVLIR